MEKTDGALMSPLPEWRLVRIELDKLPAEPYPDDLWNRKVGATWQFVFSHYAGTDGSGAVAH
jgi:hypothetical protein